VPATGLVPLTAKLISLNETVETGNDKIHHSSLICLVNELAHGLAVPEQVRMVVANVLHCWALENQMPFVPHRRGGGGLCSWRKCQLVCQQLGDWESCRFFRVLGADGVKCSTFNFRSSTVPGLIRGCRLLACVG